jgi:hypothetical protein
MIIHSVLDFFKKRKISRDKEIWPKYKHIHDTEPGTDPETDSGSDGDISEGSDDDMSSDEDEVVIGAVFQGQDDLQNSDDDSDDDDDVDSGSVDSDFFPKMTQTRTLMVMWPEFQSILFLRRVLSKVASRIALSGTSLPTCAQSYILRTRTNNVCLQCHRNRKKKIISMGGKHGKNASISKLVKHLNQMHLEDGHYEAYCNYKKASASKDKPVPKQGQTLITSFADDINAITRAFTSTTNKRHLF